MNKITDHGLMPILINKIILKCLIAIIQQKCFCLGHQQVAIVRINECVVTVGPLDRQKLPWLWAEIEDWLTANFTPDSYCCNLDWVNYSRSCRLRHSSLNFVFFLVNVWSLEKITFWVNWLWRNMYTQIVINSFKLGKVNPIWPVLIIYYSYTYPTYYFFK